MRKYLLIMMLSLFCNHLHAQTYQYVPIPTNNATWKLRNQTNWIGYGDCTRHQYTLTSNDSLIGADNYYEIMMLGSTENNTANCFGNEAFSVPFTSSATAGRIWMIEKDKRVYLLDSLPLDTSVNIHSLDFSLSYVGQSVGILHYDTVVYIDTVLINGTTRKRIVSHYYSFSQPNFGVLDTLIEGIGSVRFGLGFSSIKRLGQDDVVRGQLICFTANNQQEYVYGNSACADIWPLTISDDIKDGEGVVITPNPFINEVRLKGAKGGVLSVYNVLGRRVYSHVYSDNNEVSIPTSDWPAGMYMFITEQNGVRNIERLMKY